jgi:hypothetical protein
MDAKVYQIPQSNRAFIHSLGDDGQSLRVRLARVNVNVRLYFAGAH